MSTAYIIIDTLKLASRTWTPSSSSNNTLPVISKDTFYISNPSTVDKPRADPLSTGKLADGSISIPES